MVNEDGDDKLEAVASGDMPISTLIGDDIIAVPTTATMRQAAQKLSEANVGLVVIGDREKVEAVLSERDIVEAIAEGLDLDATLARDRGATDLRWGTVNSTVSEIIEEMMSGYFRHVLIGGDDGTLAGVVSMRDVLGTHPGWT